MQPRGASAGVAVERRTRDGRHRHRRRGRQDGAAAGGPVRDPRVVRDRRGRQRGRGGRDQRRAGPCRRGAGARRARGRGTRRRSPEGDARCRRSRRRVRRGGAHRARHAGRGQAARLPVHGCRFRLRRARHPRGRHRHLRDDPPGRRHPEPLPAAARGRVRPGRGSEPVRRLLPRAPVHRGRVREPGDVPQARGRDRAREHGHGRAVLRVGAGRRGRGDEQRRGRGAEQARRHDLPGRQHRVRERACPLRGPARGRCPRGHPGGEQPALQPHPPARPRRGRALHPGLPAFPPVPGAGDGAGASGRARSTTARSRSRWGCSNGSSARSGTCPSWCSA